MKKLLPRFSTLAFVALSIALAKAQPANVSSKEPARDEVTVTRAESSELANLRVDFEMQRQRFTNDAPQLREARARIEAVEKKQPWVISLDFPGGSLSKFLTLVGRSKVVSLNVIASDPNDLAVELPPFSLRNAQTGTIVSVLNNLLDPKGYSLPGAAGNSDPNSMNSVLIKHPDAKPANEPRAAQFDSYPVGLYLTEQSIDDIVGAIRAGWELDPTHNKDALRLKFHAPTSILLVSGPPEALHVANRIISQLKRPTPKVVKPSPSENPPPESKQQ